MELPDSIWNAGESLSGRLASSIATDMERNAMLASEKFDRGLEQHDAIMSMAGNFDQTVQDVSELNETVSGLDQRLSLLNQRVEDLTRDLDDARRKANEANEKAAKADKRYNLLLALFGAVAAEGLAMLIAWLMK